MADYIIINLTTAVVGVVTTTANQVQSQNTDDFTTTNGTISVGNIVFGDSNILSTTQPGWLTGRRPQTGQLFPRGVYNK